MAGQALQSQSKGDKSFDSFVNDPRIRNIFYQLVTVAALVAFVWMVTNNTIHNLQKAHIASGFGFLNGRAGFDIGQTLIAYSSDSTYGRALLVGILNTIEVAVFGIVTATILGFVVGIGRLSKNWLIAKLSQTYVEIFRNIPPLLVILFWYKGVIAILPQARQSLVLPFDSFLNNRGLYFPKAVWGEGSLYIALAFVLALVLSFFIVRFANEKQKETGQQFPKWWLSFALVIALPVVVYFALGQPLTFDYPIAGKFNLSGGSVIGPEFMSIYLALSFYTGAFIAENVRSGIQAVAKGQTEAASALGLRQSTITRLVVVPQAMRLIIPPLTSQYLNLTKNSSLAVAVGFSDIVSVGGTMLNQTGQAVEIIALWLVIYLSLSLSTAVLMNWFNAKMALVER